MRMKVTIDDKRFKKWIRECETGLPKELKNCLAKYAEVCYQRAYKWCPKDTHALCNSISKEILNGGTVAKIQTNGIYYAKFQEWGTVNIYAQPYMRPAYNVTVPEFVAEAKKILKDYIKSL